MDFYDRSEIKTSQFYDQEGEKTSLQQPILPGIPSHFPCKLLSLSNPISQPKHLIFDRNPNCTIKSPQSDVDSFPDMLNDYYKDRHKFISLENYKPCPTASPMVIGGVHEVQFDSQFESGNLKQVYRLKARNYILLLQPDTGTAEYSQWFYFSLKNSLEGEYRFHIVNLARPEAFISEGMGPVTWAESSPGWLRSCSQVQFAQTLQFQEYLNSSDKTGYFTMSFSYFFTRASDHVYFAYSYPYTYSDLGRLLNRLIYKPYVKVETLCKSVLGNDCEYIIVNEGSSSQKKLIFVTGRVHPGESPASYTIEGFLEFVTGYTQEAEFLRKHFVFCIVPMLNPDGVRHGNFRYSAIGVDLNRRWKFPSKEFHPTVFYTKELLKRMSKKFELALFSDFHGHSKKKNAFLYGCSRNGLETKQSSLFPNTMANQSSFFSLPDTQYCVERIKESTARVVVFKEYKIHTSYTLEVSMFGRNRVRFTIDDYKSIGEAFGRSCVCLVSFKPSFDLKSKQRSCSNLDKPRVLPPSINEDKKEFLPPFKQRQAPKMTNEGNFLLNITAYPFKSKISFAQAKKLKSKAVDKAIPAKPSHCLPLLTLGNSHSMYTFFK